MNKLSFVFLMLWGSFMTIPLHSIQLPELPLDLTYYSAPQSNGSLMGGRLVYRWSETWQTSLAARQESVNNSYEYEGMADSLSVMFEESTRLDLLALEGRWAVLQFSLGALWMNNFTWEKGFFQEIASDPVYSFEELIDFTLLGPRLGLSANLDLGFLALRPRLVLSPVFWVLQDQSYTLNSQGDQDFQDQFADGSGTMGLDVNLEAEIAGLVLLEGALGQYSYTVEEYSFGGALGGSSFDDFFDLEEKSYSRLQYNIGLSLLIPLGGGRFQVGGNYYFRSFSDAEGLGGYEENAFGLILGYRSAQ